MQQERENSCDIFQFFSFLTKTKKIEPYLKIVERETKQGCVKGFIYILSSYILKLYGSQNSWDI